MQTMETTTDLLVVKAVHNQQWSVRRYNHLVCRQRVPGNKSIQYNIHLLGYVPLCQNAEREWYAVNKDRNDIDKVSEVTGRHRIAEVNIGSTQSSSDAMLSAGDLWSAFDGPTFDPRHLLAS